MKQPLQQLSDPRNYEQDRLFALNDPSGFWDRVATKFVYWDKKYESIYNKDNLIYPEWFKGGLLNTCYNVLDLNVKNPLKKDKYAIIYECPYLNQTIKLTFEELLERVCEFSRVLLNLNISKGDMVIIHMPNTIQSIIAMLSCARIGAIRYTLHECFNVHGFEEKVNLLKPKIIISSNYGIHNENVVSYLSVLKKVMESSIHKPDSILIYNRKYIIDGAYSSNNDQISNNYFPNSFDWNVQVLKSKSNPYREYIPVESNHPLYIVFSSGTSNDNPKPSIKTNGPDLVGMSYIASSSSNSGGIMLSMALIGYESFQALIYTTLLGGNTLVFQEGIDSPQTFLKHGWKLIEKNKISKFRIPLKIIKQIIKLDKEANEAKKYDLSSLNSISLSDSFFDQLIIDYIEKKIGVLCVVLYGQSQLVYFTLSSGIKNDLNNFKKYGKPPAFMKLSILSEKSGKEINNDGEIGELCIKTPLPPGYALSYFNDNKRFEKLFQKYPGYLNTGDMVIRENGRYGNISRVDDFKLINGLPEPIALSNIDSSIFKHDRVLDCCSIYLKNENNLIGILVLKDDTSIDKELLKNEINLILANDISPMLQMNSILIISCMPRTSSGKLVRNLITNLLIDNEFKIPKLFNDNNLLNEILFNFKQL